MSTRFLAICTRMN
ncbi:hypothetical protein F383_31693 [Gossypium arboreum]|uniref:Uncharacterized protein n=1 Tax=Gossypium arboreum TaxID=29729 RepID=A0A0B0PMG8_GOSAR|nr:hypothetical protein F383_31693 [Gossypium arboreum]